MNLGRTKKTELHKENITMWKGFFLEIDNLTTGRVRYHPIGMDRKINRQTRLNLKLKR